MSRVSTVYQQTAYLFPLMLLGVVVGFWPSYFVAPHWSLDGRHLPPTQLSFHVHGTFMLLWMVVLITQAKLVMRQQIFVYVLLVLVPEQHQGHMFVPAAFLMNRGEVGEGS